MARSPYPSFPPGDVPLGQRFEFEVADHVRSKIPDTYWYYPNNVILSDPRRRPSTPPEVDLIVVGPRALFLIEAKSGMDKVKGNYFGPWTRIRYDRTTGEPLPDTPDEKSPGQALRSKLASVSNIVREFPNGTPAHLGICCVAVFPKRTNIDELSLQTPNPHYHRVNLGPKFDDLLTKWRPQCSPPPRPMSDEEVLKVLQQLTPAGPPRVESLRTYRNYKVLHSGPIKQAPNGLRYSVCTLLQSDITKRRRGKWYDLAVLGQDDRDLFEEQVRRHAVVLAKLEGNRHVHRFVDFCPSIDTNGYWVIEEEIDGESLQVILDAGREANVPIASTMRGTAHALHSLHTLPKLHVHRSLNPDAVLIERGTDRVLLGNFELTRIQGARTVTAGTLPEDPYSAPEVLASPSTATPQCDLYSWGAICFRLATGAVVSEEYRDSISRLRTSNLPGSVQRVVADCLQLVPSQRPPSAQKVLERIRDWR